MCVRCERSASDEITIGSRENSPLFRIYRYLHFVCSERSADWLKSNDRLDLMACSFQLKHHGTPCPSFGFGFKSEISRSCCFGTEDSSLSAVNEKLTVNVTMALTTSRSSAPLFFFFGSFLAGPFFVVPFVPSMLDLYVQ